MILTSTTVDPGALYRRTGWRIEPQGACRGDVCVPLPSLEAEVVAERLGMPLVRDERHGIAALGPEASGRALRSAVAPDLELPDLDGRPFALGSLRGSKVFLLAWASW